MIHFDSCRLKLFDSFRFGVNYIYSMIKTGLLKVITLTAASAGGWVAGSNYEKYRNSSKHFPTVEAAIPDMVPDTAISIENKSVSISHTSQIMKFGFPGFDQLKALDDFVLSYDRRNRTPHWVFEHLTREDLVKKDVDRSLCSFKEDTSIHPFFRATNEDYKGSGYDRGHLAAAGNHRKSQHTCDQTFLLSNMAPQVRRVIDFIRS